MTDKKKNAEKKVQKKLITEKRVAIFLAIVLVLLSVIAAIRSSNVLEEVSSGISGWFAGNNSQPASDTTSTDSGDQPADEVQTEESESGSADAGGQTDVSTRVFAYTALSGDSFTRFARTSIADYAVSEGLSMTDAQKLLAEVALVNDAGAPLLEIGQAIEIEEGDIIASLEAAGVVATSSTSTTREQDDTVVAADTYTAVAVVGDSYTAMARQAIATLDGELSTAQKVAAETFLAEAAGFPRLEVGQMVTIDADTIGQAVTRAESLTASELAAWQYWASVAGL